MKKEKIIAFLLCGCLLVVPLSYGQDKEGVHHDSESRASGLEKKGGERVWPLAAYARAHIVLEMT